MNSKFKKAQIYLSKKNKNLAKIIDQVGPCGLTISTNLSPYQSLIRSIIYQQLSTKAAHSIYNKFLELFLNKSIPANPDFIINLSESQLKKAGLSKQKISYMKNIAEAKKLKQIPGRKKILNMTSEKVVEQLTQIKGVGKWTVDMMLIFNIGHLDIFPETDLSIRKGCSELFEIENLSPKMAIELTQEWKPYRSIASWYIWNR